MLGEDQRWERLAAQNPYWTVLTEARYRGSSLTPDDERAFFQSGHRDIARSLEFARSIRPGFSPVRTLDFGCGVGRLALALASVSQQVVGVDVSDTMVRRAERHAAQRQVANAEFMTASAFWNGSPAPSFDFIHSYIVFQHIPPREGLELMKSLLRLLMPGGIGALHFTIGRGGWARSTINRARRWLPPLNWTANLLKGRSLREPLIPMFVYDIHRVLTVLDGDGATDIRIDLTRHGGFLGAMVIFQTKA